MLEMVYWAEKFIDGLSSIGDFLLYRPFEDVPVFEGLSIGNFIIAGGLTFIITYKIIKFFIP